MAMMNGGSARPDNEMYIKKKKDMGRGVNESNYRFIPVTWPKNLGIDSFLDQHLEHKH